MLTDCKCGANIDAKLDPEKNIVICTNCFEEIEVSEFTKNMMRQRKDIIERKKVTIPPNGLQYTCDNPKCNKPFSAEVDKNDGKVHCPYCGIICKVTDIMITRLKDGGIYTGYTDQFLKDEGEAQEVNEKELTKTLEKEVLSSPESANPTKRGRGRPKKNPVN